MVTRSIQVYDNSQLTVASGSPTLTPGSAIINNSDTPDGTIFQFGEGPRVTVTLDDTSSDPTVMLDDDVTHHTITDGAGIVANGQGVEAESHIYLRLLDSAGNPTGPTIDVSVLSQGGVTGDIWAFNSDLPLTVGAQYVKVGGSNIGSVSYSQLETQPVCFAQGTLIETPAGPIAIERLRPGDLVCTEDHGPQPVRWVRSDARCLDGAAPDQRPILIRAGALGPGRPRRDLVVSPQHRLLVGGAGQLDHAFSSAALAPAKALTGLRGVRDMNGRRAVTWVHIAFDRHELIRANGCVTESLLLGPMVLQSLSSAERAELNAVFTMARNEGSARANGEALNGQPARPCLPVALVRQHLACAVPGKVSGANRSDDHPPPRSPPAGASAPVPFAPLQALPHGSQPAHRPAGCDRAMGSA